ncbi:MAG TPA: hypothetical protein VMZ69_11325, partial [Saprospiraceae bacterium]|nr:hypothetical protein [Saprospiraceae bacterium]
MKILIHFTLLLTIVFLSCQSTKPKSSKSSDTSSFELEGISVDELQQKMQTGELTSHAIVQLYLNRIQQIDESGPSLNSIIELNPDALVIAD